jgi:hypothetical protein
LIPFARVSNEKNGYHNERPKAAAKRLNMLIRAFTTDPARHVTIEHGFNLTARFLHRKGELEEISVAR